MTISINTLIENAPSNNKQLYNEHGLSFLIDTGSIRVLLDCGASDNFLHNAAKMNISLDRLDCVVCSHAHWDHTGGFRPLVERHRVAKLITGEGFFYPKYELAGIRHTFLGADFDREFLSRNNIVHQVCGDMLQLSEECWLIGNFVRTQEHNTIPPEFVIRKDNAFIPDTFAEEICLAIRIKGGIALLAGCSHPGILNIVATVEERLGLPVRGVWGGTHLSEAHPDRLAATIAGLKKAGISYFGLSHCSGEAMLECIARDPDLCGCHLRTGDGLFLEREQA